MYDCNLHRTKVFILNPSSRTLTIGALVFFGIFIVVVLLVSLKCSVVSEEPKKPDSVAKNVAPKDSTALAHLEDYLLISHKDDKRNSTIEKYLPLSAERIHEQRDKTSETLVKVNGVRCLIGFDCNERG